MYDAKDWEVPITKEKYMGQVVTMSRYFRDYIKSAHEDIDESKPAYRWAIVKRPWNGSANARQQ
jgi:hypothetical protein